MGQHLQGFTWASAVQEAVEDFLENGDDEDESTVDDCQLHRPHDQRDTLAFLLPQSEPPAEHHHLGNCRRCEESRPKPYVDTPVEQFPADQSSIDGECTEEKRQIADVDEPLAELVGRLRL